MIFSGWMLNLCAVTFPPLHRSQVIGDPSFGKKQTAFANIFQSGSVSVTGYGEVLKPDKLRQPTPDWHPDDLSYKKGSGNLLRNILVTLLVLSFLIIIVCIVFLVLAYTHVGSSSTACPSVQSYYISGYDADHQWQSDMQNPNSKQFQSVEAALTKSIKSKLSKYTVYSASVTELIEAKTAQNTEAVGVIYYATVILSGTATNLPTTEQVKNGLKSSSSAVFQQDNAGTAGITGSEIFNVGTAATAQCASPYTPPSGFNPAPLVSMPTPQPTQAKQSTTAAASAAPGSSSAAPSAGSSLAPASSAAPKSSAAPGSTTSPHPTTPLATSCLPRVIFMVEMGQHITPALFATIKSTVTTINDALPKDSSKNLYTGLGTYSDPKSFNTFYTTVLVDIEKRKYITPPKLLDHLKYKCILPEADQCQHGNQTDLTYGLATAEAAFYVKTKGDYIVLLSTGKYDLGGSPSSKAAKISQLGTKIIPVAIGSNPDMDILKNISSPDVKTVYTTSNAAQIGQFLYNKMTKVCASAVEPPPEPLDLTSLKDPETGLVPQQILRRILGLDTIAEDDSSSSSSSAEGEKEMQRRLDEVRAEAAAAASTSCPTAATCPTNCPTRPIVSTTTTSQIVTKTTTHSECHQCCEPPHPTAPPTHGGTCLLDVVFVLDQSESIGYKNFDNIKAYALNVAKMMVQYFPVNGISRTDGLQFALVTFNTNATVYCNFYMTQTMADFEVCLSNAYYYPGQTFTGNALYETRKQLFTPQAGDRKGAKNLVILVTDGYNTPGSTPDPVFVADQIRKYDNGTIFSVGIKGANDGHNDYMYNELLGISGKKEYVFPENSASDMNVTDAAERLIDAIGCRPQCYADVMFIIESTELIAETGWTAEKQAMYDIIKRLGSSTNVWINGTSKWTSKSNYYGMNHFSNPKPAKKKTQIVFAPRPWTYDQIFDMTDRLVYDFYGVQGGQCDLTLGLQEGLQNAENHSYRNQTPDYRFVVFMGQGFYDIGKAPYSAAQNLSHYIRTGDNGTDGSDQSALFSIGVGPRINQGNLNYIATGQSNDGSNTYYINSTFAGGKRPWWDRDYVPPTYMDIPDRINKVLRANNGQNCKSPPPKCHTCCSTTTPMTTTPKLTTPTKPPCKQCCEPPIPYPSPTGPPKEGGCLFDVLFVLDRSESVDESNWPKVQQFVKNVVRFMDEMFAKDKQNPVGPTDMQYAVVVYNTNVTISCYFDQVASEQDLIDCVNGARYFPGLTVTGVALHDAAYQVMIPSRGDRVGYADILILVTDGHYTENTTNPVPVAKYIRDNKDATILAVGVDGLNGPDRKAFYAELVAIVGGPQNKLNVLNVTYDELQLKTTAQRLIDRIDCEQTCYADVQFIIETTELMSEKGWNKEKNAMFDLINQIGFASNNYTNVSAYANYYSAVHFSNPPPAGQKSGSLYKMAPWSLSQVEDMINPLQYDFKGIVGGHCDLELGLKLGLDDMNNAVPRNQTPQFRFAILMAEGFFDSGNPPFNAAYNLRQKVTGSNGEFYGIISGPRPKPNVMNMITTGNENNGQNVYDMNTYGNISTRINTILKSNKCSNPPPKCHCCSTSTATPSTTTPTPPAPTCKMCCSPVYPTVPSVNASCALDVVFVLDRSQSVNEKGWAAVKAFVLSVVNIMQKQFPVDIGKTGLQFAIVAYNTNVTIRCNFGDTESAAAIDNCMQQTYYYPGLTNTGEALNVTLNNVLHSPGARPKSKKYVILVTDGAYTKDTPNPVPIAGQIRGENDVIFAVGVAGLNGPDHKVFSKELEAITNNPNYVFNVSSYDELRLVKTAEQIVNAVDCEKHCFGDVAFVLESTELVALSGWNDQLNAMYKIIESLGYSPYMFVQHNITSIDSNYFSMAHFSNPISFPPPYQDPHKAHSKSGVVFRNAPWNLTQIKAMTSATALPFDFYGVQGGHCDLSLGLKLGLNTLNHPNLFSYRNQTPDFQFVIFMGQGFFDVGDKPLNDASALYNKVVSTGGGGAVYSIGVGPRQKSGTLNFIATTDTGNSAQTFNMTTDPDGTGANGYMKIPGLINQILKSKKCKKVEQHCECCSTSQPTTSTTPTCPMCCDPLPTPPGPEPNSLNHTCIYDVVFILDKSESVNEKNWPNMQIFVKNVVKEMLATFPVGKIDFHGGLQFAMVDYNTNVTIECYFDEIKSEADFNACVDKSYYYPGLTNTGLALNETYTKVMVQSRGDRPDVDDLVILVTDGAYTKSTANPVPIAKNMRENKNATIFAVGVSGLNGPNHTYFKQELDEITGNPSYVYNVSNYSNLKLVETAYSLLDKLNCTHRCGADIQFILESSELISADGWKKSKQMMYQLIDQLGSSIYTNYQNFSANANYYSLVHFSNPYSISPPKYLKSAIDIPFGPWTAAQFESKTELLHWGYNSSLNQGIQGGYTDLDLGLTLGWQSLTNPIPVPRNQTPDYKFVIFIGQGFYDSGNPPYYTAMELQKNISGTGGQIFAIGNGPNQHPEVLNYITNGNRFNSTNVYDMTNYQLLATKINHFLSHTKCHPVDPPCSCCASSTTKQTVTTAASRSTVSVNKKTTPTVVTQTTKSVTVTKSTSIPQCPTCIPQTCPTMSNTVPPNCHLTCSSSTMMPLPACLSPDMSTHDYKLDMIIFVDSSGLSSPEFYNNTYNYLSAQLLPTLNLNPNYMRLIFVMYSAAAESRNSYISDGNLTSYRSTLKALFYPANPFPKANQSDVYEALRIAYQNDQKDNRPDVPDFFVFITAQPFYASNLTGLQKLVAEYKASPLNTTISVMYAGGGSSQYQSYSPLYSQSLGGGNSPYYIDLAKNFVPSSYNSATRLLFNAINCAPTKTVELKSKMTEQDFVESGSDDSTAPCPEGFSGEFCQIEHLTLSERVSLMETYLSSGHSMTAVNKAWHGLRQDESVSMWSDVDIDKGTMDNLLDLFKSSGSLSVHSNEFAKKRRLRTNQTG